MTGPNKMLFIIIIIFIFFSDKRAMRSREMLFLFVFFYFLLVTRDRGPLQDDDGRRSRDERERKCQIPVARQGERDRSAPRP